MRHIETTLARSLYNCDEVAAYGGTALAFRDRLILDWNKTQQSQTFSDQKRVYYLSLEFLMGRALDNAMLNVGQKDSATSEFEPFPFLGLGTDDMQRVLVTWVSAWRTSSLRSTMLRSATAGWDVSQPASSTRWLP